ncbi:hypothetical protein [Paenibacillus popilliae]|uniref:Uncharacterized protein n=1 Tax=Paenibacillus popilliae ATCC 14706 TaxID=1212764 RepID=M9M5L0_PAEPP|nr:hypothetical protein [Paenibacillus popilliae]GAC42628.1 hypothetical protein PPOP_1985 [Paenibacillus popilliae ATCC 14706]
MGIKRYTYNGQAIRELVLFDKTESEQKIVRSEVFSDYNDEDYLNNWYIPVDLKFMVYDANNHLTAYAVGNGGSITPLKGGLVGGHRFNLSQDSRYIVTEDQQKTYTLSVLQDDGIHQIAQLAVAPGRDMYKFSVDEETQNVYSIEGISADDDSSYFLNQYDRQGHCLSTIPLPFTYLGEIYVTGSHLFFYEVDSKELHIYDKGSLQFQSAVQVKDDVFLIKEYKQQYYVFIGHNNPFLEIRDAGFEVVKETKINMRAGGIDFRAYFFDNRLILFNESEGFSVLPL